MSKSKVFFINVNIKVKKKYKKLDIITTTSTFNNIKLSC